MASTLLDALLRNESGGRNIPNVHQGTSSGQAQGYFQITTGTWDEFGGRKYAANPLQATYEQQADIASRIPLRRWDESTVNLMRATGRPINPNQTLGQNLAANNESFNMFSPKGGGVAATRPANPGDPGLNTPDTRLPASTPFSGGAPATFTPAPSGVTAPPAPTAVAGLEARKSPGFQMPDLASLYGKAPLQAPPGIMPVTQPGPYDPSAGTRQQKLIEALMSNLGGGGIA